MPAIYIFNLFFKQENVVCFWISGNVVNITLAKVWELGSMPTLITFSAFPSQFGAKKVSCESIVKQLCFIYSFSCSKSFYLHRYPPSPINCSGHILVPFCCGVANLNIGNNEIFSANLAQGSPIHLQREEVQTSEQEGTSWSYSPLWGWNITNKTALPCQYLYLFWWERALESKNAYGLIPFSFVWIKY